MNLKFWQKKDKAEKKKKTPVREWTDAILFAVIAATLIRWLFIEAFKIPTPSMEKTLLVGDFLFVSKIHYGARVPKTPLQLPLTHQKIWFTEMKSYLDWVQLPDMRLPGFSEIERNDVVVFNFPPEEEHPADLKTNYIKRCVGVPGDKFEIKNGEVLIDGKKNTIPSEMETGFLVVANQDISDKTFRRFDITDREQTSPLSVAAAYGGYKDLIEELRNYNPQNSFYYRVHTLPSTAEELKKLAFVKEVYPIVLPKGVGGERIYPKASKNLWSQDNYGPITIPGEGVKVEVNKANMELYGEIIRKYEGLEEVKIENGTLSIDGNSVSEYTFKQNYYFMMGDNRHNSLDSRFWGFVPENHVVGKGLMIWWSVDADPTKGGMFNRIRWDRIGNIIE